MIHFAIVAGGIAGALARHGVGTVAAVWAGSLFPWGTLTVNVAGSVLLGLLMPFFTAPAMSPALRAGLTIGFCGGFTTFSTFAYEAVALARGGDPALAAAYVVASLLLGVAAMLAGLHAGTAVMRRFA